MSKFIKMYTFDTWAPYVIIYQLCLKQFFKTPSIVCGVSNIELVNCSFIIENPILPILTSKASALTHTIFGYGFRCLSAFTVMAERGISDGGGSCYGITQFRSFSRQVYISSCELLPFNSLLLCELFSMENLIQN